MAAFKYAGNRLDGRGIQQISGRISGGTKRDLDRRARNVEAAAKQLVPVRTGALKRTIRRESGSGYVEVVAGRVGKTPYLGWVLRGTEPHIIRVRRRKALRWVQDGEVRFAKYVHHPGTAPNDFLGKALLAARD